MNWERSVGWLVGWLLEGEVGRGSSSTGGVGAMGERGMNEGIEGRRGGGEKIPERKMPKTKQKNTYFLGLDKWSHWLDLGFFFFFSFFLLFFWSIVASFGFYGWDRIG